MNVPHPPCVSRPGAMDPLVWGVWLRPDRGRLLLGQQASEPASDHEHANESGQQSYRLCVWRRSRWTRFEASRPCQYFLVATCLLLRVKSTIISHFLPFVVSLSVSAEPRLVSSFSFWRDPLLWSLCTSPLSEPLFLFLFSLSRPLAVCLRDLEQHLKQLREARKGLCKCSARTYTRVMHQSWSSPAA